MLFFLFIRCANDNGADQHELRNCFWLISAVVVYLLHSTCILPRVSLFQQKQPKNNKALACPCSRIYLVYVRHGRKQKFFLCWAHVWLGKYTCICYMYNCVFCLLQHRFRTPLSHSCLQWNKANNILHFVKAICSDVRAFRYFVFRCL